jgi:hypothetical protein
MLAVDPENCELINEPRMKNNNNSHTLVCYLSIGLGPMVTPAVSRILCSGMVMQRNKALCPAISLPRVPRRLFTRS